MYSHVKRGCLAVVAGLGVGLGGSASLQAGPVTGALTLEPSRAPFAAFAAATTAGSAPAAYGPQPADAFVPSGAEYAWGDNSFGGLGNSSTTRGYAPAPVSSANGFNSSAGVTAVAAGGAFGMGLQNGTVYTWGRNNYGQLGNGSTTQSNVPVQVSSANGFTNTGVTAISGGYFHALAVQNGTVYAWGDNGYAQLGNTSAAQSSVPVKVIAANGFTNTNTSAVAAGTYHNLALQNGTVYAWGTNSTGQLGIGSTLYRSYSPLPVASANGFTNTGVTAVAAGLGHSLAIQGGALYAWGDNAYGELGNNSTAGSNAPVAVFGLSTGVTSIATGNQHSLAVQNGNVFAWGLNSKGQLGDGTTNNSAVPLEVSFGGSVLSNIVQVAAGYISSYALASDGSLYVWGDNSAGELGLGSYTASYATPQHLLPPTGKFYQFVSGNQTGETVVAILGDTPPVAVPEPAPWLGGALLGLAGVGAWRRRTWLA